MEQNSPTNRQIQSQQDEDIILVKRAQKGDRQAFNTLINKYKDFVFNICCKFLDNEEEANDCAQEAFIKIFKGLKKFKYASKFSTWLYRIVINTCKNKVDSLQYRQAKHAVRIDSSTDHSETAIIRDLPDNTTPCVSKKLEHQEHAEIIHSAIQTLKEEFKTVLILCDIQGCSYKEVEKICGINFGTVKSRLSRARQMLKEKLKGAVYEV
ncbi:MAG: sigma-70 family RNA polymerase sigma factor [Elusimicrobiota bacterium]